MSKIAVVTDSNSGITQALAKELGVFVVPMPFVIDGETFFEDINLTQAAFYERLKDDADISTSQPAVGDILDLWDRLLQEYEALVHIPMSSGLSGSCATARSETHARAIMIDAMRRDIGTRFGGVDQVHLYVAHTNNEAAAREFAAAAEQELGIGVTYCDPLSLSVSCHVGSGTLGIGCSKKIDRYL